MYRKGSKGWFKHYDFILLDMICLQVAFVVAYILRCGLNNPYMIEQYRNMSIVIELADIGVILFFETLKNVLKRGHYKEIVATVKHTIFVEGLAVLYLFTIKGADQYSRAVMFLTAIVYVVLGYVARTVWKVILRRKMEKGGDQSLVIVTTSDIAVDVVKNLKNNNYKMFKFTGIAIIDKDMIGEDIGGVKVVADAKKIADYVCRMWVDEVFVVTPKEKEYPQRIIDEIIKTGVTVHVSVFGVPDVAGVQQFVEKIGNYTVLTTSINYMTTKQAILKRLLDIVGGIVGSLFTILLTIIIGPIIFISSPGPIFFSQIRVGKNGKRFKIYKFRSMYMDAEKRKAELMAQNRVKDGMMFKVDFDTRIIGNKILSSGKKKTGVGQFIRSTSLDEFPQFFNVLKGDMSLVGTRPPTVDEWEKYELHHRARLAIKPGITGMWQTSGRSEITDFEEVVKLDTKYISEWSMGLDFRLLFKTVLSVVKREGSM